MKQSTKLAVALLGGLAVVSAGVLGVRLRSAGERIQITPISQEAVDGKLTQDAQNRLMSAWQGDGGLNLSDGAMSYPMETKLFAIRDGGSRVADVSLVCHCFLVGGTQALYFDSVQANVVMPERDVTFAWAPLRFDGTGKTASTTLFYQRDGRVYRAVTWELGLSEQGLSVSSQAEAVPAAALPHNADISLWVSGDCPKFRRPAFGVITGEEICSQTIQDGRPIEEPK